MDIGMKINVTKRDGTKEPLNLEKLHKVVFWATEGLSGVSASEVELRSQIQFFDGMKTSDIQETLIKAAADLISEDHPNYQYVAGRLVNYHLRKQVHGRFQALRLFDVIKTNVEKGFYDPALLTDYTESEWDEIGGFVNHERDMALTYVAMEQMRGKYLVQNRVTGEILETPQILYILVAAVLFARYPKETRLQWVRDYYESISKHEISLPTPIMSGVRTAVRQYSSCTLIECGDSLKSINATSAAVIDYVSQRAGIGIGAGSIRALGSPIRNGDASHTGLTPFFKHFQSAVNSCNQGGVRKGSATLYYPIWHLEVESLLVLKNNKGVEENRVRHMDYGVQFSKLFYERLITGGEITLFSPSDVPGLYEAFFADQDKFKQLYETAERNTRLRKKKVKALELFTTFVNERKDTGRIYLMNVDNANTHSSFDEKVAPVHMSNLCCEITLTTTPMGTVQTQRLSIPVAELVTFMEAARANNAIVNVVGSSVKTESGLDEAGTPWYSKTNMVEVEREDDMSRIALCTLSAINWGVIKSPHDFERICRLAVRALDNLLDHQEYPVLAAQKHTQEYRPLGIGIINFAYFLAKNGVKYTDGSGIALVDQYAEAWSYYLIKASVELAKEKGACLLSKNTKYHRGIVPIDTRKAEVDELIAHEERLDWDSLRADLKKYGIRNATLMALMPAETSAQIANATNGIEAPRSYVSVKQSKHGVLKQVVPEIRKLKKNYELLWDQKSPLGYLQLCAILQKYIDQAISVNTSYNPKFYEDDRVPMSELLKHIMLHYKWGGKTLYYNNTNDSAGEIDVHAKEAVAEDENISADEEECDACRI
jgi:ribonucleoside-diphosphate reductase alpha chain